MRRIDIVHAAAGLMVFTSAVLAILINQKWLYLTIFVGLNLFQYGFTGWCPLERMLKARGIK